MIIKNTLLSFAIVASFIGCEDDYIPNKNVMPPSFYFVIVDSNGNCISDSTIDLNIYLIKDGVKTYIDDITKTGFFKPNNKYDSLYGSLGVPIVNLNNPNIDHFYFVINGQDADTLIYHLHETNDAEEAYVENISYNGIEPFYDKSLSPFIYVLKK